MSAYELETVIRKWETDKLTPEQTIGQILLLLQDLSERVSYLEARQEERRRQGRVAGGAG
jgi:glutamate 5-kinase